MSQYETVVDVDDGDQVHPASLLGPDLGQVRLPELVWTLGQFKPTVMLDRLSIEPAAKKTQFLHHSVDPLVVDHKPVSTAD